MALSCSARPGAGEFISVHVTWEPGVTARCFVVRATGEGQAPRTTSPMLRGMNTLLTVAIFRDDAPAEVNLEALGFADEACLEPTGEVSAMRSASFVKQLADTGLELRVLVTPIASGTDVDGDGSPTPADCDDGNPGVRPGLPEACGDTFDNDCDDVFDCADPDCLAQSCGLNRVCVGIACAEANCGNGLPCDGGSCNADGGCVPGGTPWPYEPTNFDPALIPTADSGLVIDCLEVQLDTEPVPAALTSMGCSSAARLSAPLTIVQLAAGEAVLVSASSFFLDAGARLTLVGSRPVIFAISGDVTIAGELVAAARGGRPGAGADFSCGTAAGASGTAGTESAPGGSGGAFGSAGGAGGPGSMNAGTPAGPTTPVGNASLVPLRGGCSGGVGAGTAGGSRGRGGGGVQLSSAGSIAITGLVGAPGEGGDGASPGFFGGGGAGSGGGVLLEAATLELSAGGRVLALGGGGGEGSSSVGGNPGAPGSRTDGVAAPGGFFASPLGGAGGAGASRTADAGAGTPGVLRGAGGGGGAGVGRVRFNSPGTCTFLTGSLVSPSPTSADGGCQ